jgi:hypothetical protein
MAEQCDHLAVKSHAVGCQLPTIGFAVVLALCLVAATPARASAKGAAGPLASPARHAIAAAKPKRCKARKVRVLLNGKAKCFTAAALRNGAPGANAVDMLIRATASRGLWRKRRHPSVYKALTRGGRKRLLAAERALYATSRSVGRQLLPFDPGTALARKRAGGGEETLDLQVPGWLDPKRQQEIREAVSGVQTVDATTSGSKTMKPPDASNTGDYQLHIKEKFVGDPCPNKDGLVVGIATFIVDRTRFLPSLQGDTENVATITVTFRAVVNKSSTIDSYEMLARLDSLEGGWHGSIEGKKLRPGVPPFVIVDFGDFKISAPTGLDKENEKHLAAATLQALLNTKHDEVDKWLKQAQVIFKDRAKCNKVKGDGGKLKPGQQKTFKGKVESIRGPTTNSKVTLRGLNGLEVVSAHEVTTAKDGTFEVTVRAPSTRSLAAIRAGQPYQLGVEGVSELGRAVGTVTFEGLPERISGTFSGTETRTIPGVGDSSATFSGTVTFVRTEASFDPSSATYEVEQLNYTTTASISGGGCSGSATDSASFGIQDQVGTLTLAYEETPGKGQAYEMLVDAERPEPGSMTVNCPTGSHDVEWAVAASLTTGNGNPYYTDGAIFRGTYSVGAGTSFTCTWDLKGSD